MIAIGNGECCPFCQNDKFIMEKDKDFLKHLTEDSMWNNRPICLLLDDNTWIIPQCDDEGNDGGALYVINPVKDKSETLPVI